MASGAEEMVFKLILDSKAADDIGVRKAASHIRYPPERVTQPLSADSNQFRLIRSPYPLQIIIDSIERIYLQANFFSQFRPDTDERLQLRPEYILPYIFIPGFFKGPGQMRRLPVKEHTDPSFHTVPIRPG